MKKLLSLLLAAMMLLGCIPAIAEDAPEWKVNKNTGLVKRDSSFEDFAHIVIPAEVDGIPVRGIQYMALSFCDGMTQLTIPDSVRFFDEGTLSRHYELKDVKLPRDLTVILRNSLSNLALVESIVVPPSVSLIQASFNYNKALKSITFEGVCPHFVQDSYYPEFADLPEDCVIYVPDDQVEAYKAALSRLEDLVSRIRPSGKKAVVIDWKAPESDFKFDASTGTVTAYTGSASRIEIPAAIGGVQVKHIGKNAFQQKYSLMYVTLPEGVETVAKNAFQGNVLLSYVSLPSALHTLEEGAFSSCNLVDVGWSEGLENVGSGAFYNCDISYATLPSTLRIIADEGFENAGFAYLTFGPNVEKVGQLGFSGDTLVSLTYTGKAMPKFGADAFKNQKKEATLTLAPGSSKELYEDFVEYMADAFPACVVNEPSDMEMPFPALDVMAGMPFFGTWNGVAVTDGVDMYGMDLLGMTVEVVLNPDGTGTLAMDTEVSGGKWYMDNGAAVFAPILHEGEQPALEEAVPFILDENGRMNIDFGGIILLLEQEGKAYTAPVIPEKPWPELDQDNAKYFIGTWEAIRYEMDGESYDASLLGSAVLTLNKDGSAVMEEEGEEPYALRWYAEYGTAYVGPAMNDLVSVTFDGKGNIKLDQDGAIIIMAPKKESAGDSLTITRQPADAYAAKGREAVVSFEAEGEGLTYKWYYKDKGAKEFLLSSKCTDNQYVAEMNEARNGRQVYCVVTDQAGHSAKTDTVTLNMSNGPQIVSQPKSASAGKGKEVRTEVQAEGEKLTYTWYYKDKGAKEFLVSSKCTENFYTAEMNEARNGRQVYCVVTDKDGKTVKSETVTLTLKVIALQIVAQPKDVAVEKGKEARTEVQAEGEKLTYTWYYKDKGAKEFLLSSKCTENYYTAEMNEARNGRQVYCVVTDKDGKTVKSETVTLTLKVIALQIVAQPEDVAVEKGKEARTEIKAEGEKLTYAWYYKDKGAKEFLLSSKCTENFYTAEMNEARNGRQVYCVVTDKNGKTVQSETVTLSLKKAEKQEQPQKQDTILGHWDDGFKLLDVYEDGRMELTYKSDGYVSKMEWAMVKGVPTITKGIWKDIPMTLEKGLLIITRDTLYQEFARVGDAPSGNVNGGQEEASDKEAVNDLIAYVPGTMDDFIGGWICADDETIQLLLLENEANLIDPDGCLTVDWEIVNGVAEFNGMKLYLQEDYSGVVDMGGELIMFNRGYVEKPDDGFAFDMTGDDELSDEEALLALLELLAMMEEQENENQGNQNEFNYLDIDFHLTGAHNALTTIDHTMYGEYKVKFLSNGKAEFVQGGQALAPEYLTWAINEEGAYVLSYAMMGVTYLTYTFVPNGEALNMDFYGTTMIFTPVN